MIHDLYLMRHGQTLWNAEGRLQGRLDSPLTDRGRMQAASQAAILRDVGHRHLFSSPQGRAQQTAEIVFGGRPFCTDPRLAEIDIGGFTGRLMSELHAEHPHLFPDATRLDWYDSAPDGEGLRGLMARCQSFLDDLSGPALIVTHGITLRMLRLIAMRASMHRLAELPVRQGAVHVVSRARHWTLHRPQRVPLNATGVSLAGALQGGGGG